MRTSRIASLLIGQIERYRRSEVAAIHAGTCPFSPSCSHYGEQALRRRALPMALFLITWRLLRCRRSVTRGTWDPVPSRRRSTPRKVAAVLLLSGIVTLGTAGLASAVAAPTGVTVGGCRATIDGGDITAFNRNHPLNVSKGQSVVVQGLAPQDIRNIQGEPAGSHWSSVLEISLVSPATYSVDSKGGSGYRTFTSTQNVDTYLKYGSGLYRVTVHATGAVSGPPVWTCAATFYVKLHGGQAGAWGAGAVAVIGLGGIATASGKTDWASSDVVPPDEQYGKMADDPKRSDELVAEANSENVSASRQQFLCLVAILIYMLSTKGGLAAAAVTGLGGGPGPDDPPGRVFWRRGHPVRGFVGGLFAGLGLAVLMQQLGYWILTWENTIAFPLVLALASGWRGWRGRAFRVTYAPRENPTAEPA
jgi:putative component of membrane protein insertase Oxa1/YidC/SpoIIIJ protein YidD